MKRNLIKVQKSCQSEKYKKIVITAVDSKGICCSLQEMVEQDVLSFKHYEHALISIILRKYYIYIRKDEEQQTKTLAQE